MTIETAIKQVIESGYKHPKEINYMDAELALCMQDPKFWQALGKAMGWGENEIIGTVDGIPVYNLKKWLKEWHQFIDYLASNGTADDYFKSLN